MDSTAASREPSSYPCSRPRELGIEHELVRELVFQPANHGVVAAVADIVEEVHAVHLRIQRNSLRRRDRVSVIVEVNVASYAVPGIRG